MNASPSAAIHTGSPVMYQRPSFARNGAHVSAVAPIAKAAINTSCFQMWRGHVDAVDSLRLLVVVAVLIRPKARPSVS